MNITQEQLQFIINSDVEQLVSYLQTDEGLSLSEAFETVYNSAIYSKLINTDTGLYLQSPDYIYDYLKEEMAKTSLFRGLLKRILRIRIIINLT